MDVTRDDFEAGRQAMRESFIDLITLAQLAGVGWSLVSEQQQRFWSGNVQIKDAFDRANLVARSDRPAAD